MSITKRKAACAALLLLCGAIANAQKKPITKSATVATANLAAPEKLTSVEGITEYRLGNGLHVLLFPDPSKPTITVNVTYKVGSRHEGYGETGMAHLLEHMVFKGATHHPHIPQELTSHGASPNGSTWYDRTNYFETFSATDENLNWALDMESDRMVNSFIADKDLQSEFSVVRNEFESGENNAGNVLMERILSTAYLWHNYGKSTIGSKEDIEKVPIKNLQAFYRKYYQPDNAVCIVSGKIDEPKTLALVNHYFGVIPRPARALEAPYTIEPVQDGERFAELRRVGDVQAVACAYHIPAEAHPDYPAVDVLSQVLTNDPNGRLYQALVKTGKASAIWSWAAGLHDPGFFYINADVLKEKSLDSARSIFFATIDGLHTKPVTAEETEKAKAKLLKDFEQLYRNTERIGLELSEYIGAGDWRLAFLYRDELKKVTAADVNRVANNYLVNSNRTSGVFIPTQNAVRAMIPATPNVDSMMALYKGGEALAAGEAFDPSPDNIDKRTEHVNLTGGARYVLLEKSTRGGGVVANITLRLGDEGSMMNKAGVASLTAAMLRHGTKEHTQAQINELLDKLSTTLSIYSRRQTVSITLQSTHANLPAALDLVYEMLHEPAFPAAEFKTVQDEQISNLEQERSEPTSIASRQLNILTSNYPAGHVLHAMTVDEEEADIKAVNDDDIRKFYADYYNGSSATASVVGDFDATVIRQHLDKTLNNWGAVKSFTRVPDPYQEIAAVNKEYKTPDKKNAMFFASQNLKIRDDNPDYPALQMGDFIFGGGFLNSRLAMRIRQHDGISYGVGSWMTASALDESGTFGTYAIYNPDNKEKLEKAFREELAKMVSDGITEDELKAAKSGIIQYRQNGRAEDPQLAGKLNSNTYYNRTMAWDKSIDGKLQALTVADVNRAMKKYLDPNKVTFVKAGDFK